MSADALYTAFVGLLAGVTVHKDTVPTTPTYPYVLLTTNYPQVSERSTARTGQASLFRVRSTVVAGNGAACLGLSGKVFDLLEGKRISVTGWVTGSIESVPNEQGIQTDTDVTIPNTNNHPAYAVYDWVLTASKSPA
jgi:hypothetical protein